MRGLFFCNRGVDGPSWPRRRTCGHPGGRLPHLPSPADCNCRPDHGRRCSTACATGFPGSRGRRGSTVSGAVACRTPPVCRSISTLRIGLAPRSATSAKSPSEPVIPFVESLLHVDCDLVVADKPHFLPVTPAGATSAKRCCRGCSSVWAIATWCRCIASTATPPGLVLFSANPATRDAVPVAVPRSIASTSITKRSRRRCLTLSFPLTRRTRLERGEPFFRMQENRRSRPNSETRIDVIDRIGPLWRYALNPSPVASISCACTWPHSARPSRNDPTYPRDHPHRR